MRYLVAERGLGLAILIVAFGIFLILQATFVVAPVLISEKGLLLLLAGIGLLVIGVFVALRSIKKVSSNQ